MPTLEFLGGGDVGKHHELLDQPMAAEPWAGRDGDYPALLQHHLTFGQIEIERAAGLAGAEQRTEGSVKRRDDAGQVKIPSGVVRVLHLRIGQARGAAHQATAETVRRLAPGRVDPHLGEQATTLLLRAKAAPTVG